MRFHKKHCYQCGTETLFLEKLINPQDVNCTKMEDVCQNCSTKAEKPLKPKPRIKF